VWGAYTEQICKLKNILQTLSAQLDLPLKRHDAEKKEIERKIEALQQRREQDKNLLSHMRIHNPEVDRQMQSLLRNHISETQKQLAHIEVHAQRVKESAALFDGGVIA
jgi:hypothetical protein